MRAAIDTILLAAWAALAFAGVLWFLCTAFPGDHCQVVARILITAFPLLSAYRVQHNYHILRVRWWAAGLWLFSLSGVLSYTQLSWAALYESVLLASLLFIALPVPMLRVWRELRRLLK